MQSLDSEVVDCHEQLQRMNQVLASFPSTSHVSFKPTGLQPQLHEMEAALHTLSARIQVRTQIPIINQDWHLIKNRTEK